MDAFGRLAVNTNDGAMTWSLQRKVLIGFTTAFFVLLAVGVSLFSSIQGVDSSTKWQNHTYNVISKLQNIVINIQESRSNQRSYVLTGELAYIGAYYKSTAQLDKDLASAKTLLKDNPLQAKRLEAIRPLVRQELGIFKQVMDARYRRGFADAIELMRRDKPQLMMGKIRSGIAVMKAEELRLLQARRMYAQTNVRLAFVTTAIGSVLVFLLIGALYYIINREIKERESAESQLGQRNRILENALDGIAQLDQSGCYVAVNKAYAAMVGYKLEELLGLSADANIPAESREITSIAYNTMRQEGRAEFEALDKRKDGSTFFKRVVFVVNQDANGQYLGYFCFMKDITEQRYLQDIVKQNEERMRSLVEGVKDYSIIMLDVNGQVTTWNAGAEKIKGYKAEEIIGRHFSYFYPEAMIRQGHPEFALRQAKLNGNHEEEGWRIRKDGTQFWSNVIITALRNDHGELIGFSKISRDLTDRKQAEERFQVLFEHSSDAHLIFDDTGIIDCNEATVRILKAKDKSSILCLHPAALSPEFQSDGQPSMVKCREMDELAYKNGHHRFEWMHRKFTGEAFPVEVSLTPVMLAGKTAMLTVWHDLTERKAFEKKLIENESRFRSAMDYAPIGMALVSTEGNFLQVNNALCSIVGYKKDELLAIDFQSITHPDDLKADVDLLVKLITDEITSYEMEKRYIHKDGHIVWIQLNVYLLRDMAGEPIHFIAQIQDITARKNIEKELVEAKEAALDAVDMKSTFLANMSHEIRTPMNGILGLTEIIMKSPLDEIQRRHLTMVQSSARSLLSIINDILDFSKIEAGKLTFDPIPFKLRESLEETLNPFSQLVQDKHLELLYRVGTDVPNQLVGDPSRLRQLVTNLIGNALKFTEEGEVLLDISLESSQPDGVCLHFKVSDTGIGLSPEKQKIIFEPFSQAEGSTSRRYGGTGLGLSICKKLVEVMQGNIWVESEEDKGSTFHFTARFDISSSPGSVMPVRLEELKELPVLLVDDNLTNLHIMKESLAFYDMKPQLAGNGQLALKLLKKAVKEGTPYSVVILDIVMPGMNGFEVAKEIKENPLIADTKIVIMTAYGQAGDAIKCRELGIEAYLTKPLSQNTLIESIKSVLGVAHEGDVCELKTPLITKHLLRETLPSLNILMAEDNDVNRIVAETMLLDLGHTVFTVQNGKMAVEEYQHGEYDLILMDIHMPEMDGFEATAAIRLLEQSSGKHIPIVALTANAIKGDRERCLAAGMDGYVSKPFERQELVDAIRIVVPASESEQRSIIQKLEKQVGADKRNEEPQPVDTSEGTNVILDKERILDRLGGKVTLLEKVITMFKETHQNHLDTIAESVSAKDAEALNTSAHALKGVIGNFSTAKAYELAHALEQMGKAGDFSHAEETFESLTVNVSALLKALELFLEGEKHS